MLPCKGMNTAKIGGDLGVEDSREKKAFWGRNKKQRLDPHAQLV
jgi:hypothetical protein